MEKYVENCINESSEASTTQETLDPKLGTEGERPVLHGHAEVRREVRRPEGLADPTHRHGKRKEVHLRPEL